MNAPLFISEAHLEHRDANCTGYPFSIPAIRNFERLVFESPVTFFTGENGSGKSTLLEALAIKAGFNAEGGSKHLRFATQESHSPLHRALRIIRRGFPKSGYFLRAESFYNVATEIDRLGVQDSHGGRSLHTLSHGESFLTLFTERFHANGLYLLDEPEAALSPARQLALLARIYDLARASSQFIIATHSPILLAYPGAQILSFTENGITPIAYRETEAYTLTHRFLSDPEGMLARLFEE